VIEKMQTITREQYLKGNGEQNHRAYYSQFVNPSIKETVKNTVGIDALLKSNDPHLNDIPLKIWDNMMTSGVNDKMLKLGDYLTLAGKVCVLKEAARQLIEERRA
jgi:hypothetical protein